MGLVHRAGTHCTYRRRDGQAELTWVAGYIPRWFTHLQMVTHPSTNRARRWLTLLMRPTTLPTEPNRHRNKMAAAAIFNFAQNAISKLPIETPLWNVAGTAICQSRPMDHRAVGTGPADPAAAGPIIWQTQIFMFTLYQFSRTWVDSSRIYAIRCQILMLKCTKFDFCWGSAPDPLAGFKAPIPLKDGRRK